MTIVFICGCLEPGKDGVGDYTRRLAAELQKQGHYTAAIAFNDGFVQGSVVRETLSDDGVQVSVMRLPSKLRSEEKIIAAKSFVEQYAPDFLSLQFVPFAFHIKGVPFNLSSQLKSIGEERRWHIMFHELWVGINSEKSSLKNALLKNLQRGCITNMIKKLETALITTSIKIYKESLNRKDVRILPLFSNIPFSDSAPTVQNDEFRIVSFGTLSADETGFELQLKKLMQLGQAMGKKTVLKHVGSGGPFKSRSLKIAEGILGFGNVEDLGLCSANAISETLSMANVGISRADGMLWGKSGTTMAMLEHGLPVILKGERNLYVALGETIDYESQIFFYSDIKPCLKKQPPFNAVTVVAAKMESLLRSKNEN